MLGAKTRPSGFSSAKWTIFRSVKASSLEQKCRHEGTVAIDSQILSFRSRRRRNLRHHGVREATSCLLHHKHHRDALAWRRPQKRLALVETRNLPAWTLRRTAVKNDCDARQIPPPRS